MALSGSTLLWFLGLLALGLPVLALLLWSRLRGPRGVVVPARLSLVVASQLAAVLLVGAALNDYAYFYGTWGDLWSSVTQTFDSRYPVAPVTYRHGAGRQLAVRPAGVTPIKTHLGISTSSRLSKTGRLESVHVQGGISQLGTRAYVYLPPQYYQAPYAHTRFPGVEVISGFPSTEKMVVHRLAFQRKLRHAIEQHKARPMVLVMVRPAIGYPRDTECTNIPGGLQVESYYAQDLPKQISSHYRVLPTGWGIAGVSTGGYCATKIAMGYPGTFHAAVSLSGYFQALKDYTTGDLWGGSSVIRGLNSPEWLLQHQPAPPVSLLVTVSKHEAGPYGYRDTQRFLRLVRRPMKVSAIIVNRGGHLFKTWNPEIPVALHWLSDRLYGVRPTVEATPVGTAAGSRISAGPSLAGLQPAVPSRSARGLRHWGGRRRPRARR